MPILNDHPPAREPFNLGRIRFKRRQNLIDRAD